MLTRGRRIIAQPRRCTPAWPQTILPSSLGHLPSCQISRRRSTASTPKRGNCQSIPYRRSNGRGSASNGGAKVQRSQKRQVHTCRASPRTPNRVRPRLVHPAPKNRRVARAAAAAARVGVLPLRAKRSRQGQRSPGRSAPTRLSRLPDRVFGRRGLLLRLARRLSSSRSHTAGSATERKPRPSAADFCFDPIASSEAASARTDSCSVSAQREAVASGDEMLVGAGREGLGGRGRSPVLPQAREPVRVNRLIHECAVQSSRRSGSHGSAGRRYWFSAFAEATVSAAAARSGGADRTHRGVDAGQLSRDPSARAATHLVTTATGRDLGENNADSVHLPLRYD
jgi:hypothetical protein